MVAAQIPEKRYRLYINSLPCHPSLIYVHVCLCLSILEGTAACFTQEPSNPSYFNNGSDANLVWDYTDPNNTISDVTYGVVVQGAIVNILVNNSLGVQEHSAIPLSYKRRVKLEGRATLVIENISPGDNKEFICELSGDLMETIVSKVQLIVTGMYHRV